MINPLVMEYLADLHIHSPFSRATSRQSTLAGLYAWARVKGIHVIGTGDFTHPGWFRQLRENLEPAEPGFFRLKDENVPPAIQGVTPDNIPVRFVLTAEISGIYKRGGMVRKVHNILFAPDLESAERINAELAGIGNIESDGRPILGLDSRDLLEIQLEKAEDGFLVPAHVWTPWFSLFGSKSGFDSIEECFGDLAGHVFALETGLSSDPDMNRLISALDRFTLISNSDCHSPSKLGREANRFNTGFDFFSLRQAMMNPDKGFDGTVEFFPEEGKYHFDGHRKCGVCLDPLETRRLESLCPECGKPLTVGVHHRVLELADRKLPHYPEGSPGFRSLIPLPEVLGEMLSSGPATKTVMAEFGRLISIFGSEFNLLMNAPVEEIQSRHSTLLAEAVKRIRERKVIRRPGFDGEFGVIRVFEEDELDSLWGQAGLFGAKGKKKSNKPAVQGPLPSQRRGGSQKSRTKKPGPNPGQLAAITTTGEKILVSAGPGTGKTFTLVLRLVRLLDDGNAPDSIVAITFTNRAADEVRERLRAGAGNRAEAVFVGTFHRFCLDWLRRVEPDLTVAGQETRDLLVRKLFPDWDRKRRKDFSGELTVYFQSLAAGGRDETLKCDPSVKKYLRALEESGAIDLDGVIPLFVRKLKTDTEFHGMVSQATAHLLIDEFQDLNHSQYEMVEMMAAHARVFAIGDPDQAIYGFRGSDPAFFLDFARKAETLSLTRNYRSAPDILEAAQGVIHQNAYTERVELMTDKTLPGFIEHYSADTAEEEAEFIVRRIEEAMGGISHFSINSGRGGEEAREGVAFSDIAVLFRLFRQSEYIAGALERRGIPFQLVGSTPFFMKPEIRAAYYLVQAAAGLAETAEYLALLGVLKGIGKATLARLEDIPINCDNFFDAALAIRLTAGTGDTIIKIRDAISKLKKSWSGDAASSLENALSHMGIDNSCEGRSRFMDLAMAFGKDLVGFASHLRQQAEAAVYDERAEAVSLMTLHASKGLEFPVVFIAGIEEGLLPHTGHEGNCYNPEEERRLFYVGLTRALDGLVLTSSAKRVIHGRTLKQRPSRFLDGIPARLIKRPKKDMKQKKRNSSAQMSLFTPQGE